MQSNLTTRLPVSSAADACGLSRSWFRSLFKDTMGMTYSQFERRARLARAARLLLTTTAPIEAIAEEVGFADGSHFHRAFLKHYARTPDEFRTGGRQIRERPEPDHG
ncbi:MAG: helix-turn-helix domain-containing protein [Xanthomonadales bacterium]|nr:helix-turn-helix domain-containing protein [Xanthomonadales bacterium]